MLADEGHLAPGSSIFQPGLLDGGDTAKDTIAKLTKFIPLSTTSSNKVDCAIAELTPGNIGSATIMPKIGKLSSPNTVDAITGMRVHKVGRTTGYTTGSVHDVNADVTVGYDGGPILFQEQIIIIGDAGGSFSQAGDSGSMIVDRATGRATALLFAGSASHTIANHMNDVLAALGVELAT